jgi:hypothetical protein
MKEETLRESRYGHATIGEDEALVESLEDMRKGQVAEVDAAAIVTQESLVGVLQTRDAHDHVLVRDERALGHALQSGGDNQGDGQQGGARDRTRRQSTRKSSGSSG